MVLWTTGSECLRNVLTLHTLQTQKLLARKRKNVKTAELSGFDADKVLKPERKEVLQCC
jgi:hypothetical protein